MKRLSNGLVEGVNYVRDEKTGKINWLKTMPIEYLYIKSDPKNKARIEQKYGKKYEELDIIADKIEDSDLCLTLPGIRWLLEVRGYNSCDIRLDTASIDYVAATCKIEFIENEECKEQRFTSNACAHLNNNYSFMRQFLVESASNRAFCRAVRNYLNINIISREELGAEEENGNQAENGGADYSMIKNLMEKKNFSFEQVKLSLVKGGLEEAKEYKKVEDIPKNLIFRVIEGLSKSKQK